MPTPRPVAVTTVLAIGLATYGVGPVGAQGPSLARHGTIAGSASAVAATNDLLVVADGPTVRVIDVSQPETPNEVGRHEFADDVLALTLDGGSVYVANSHEGLHRLDISNPSAPVPGGSVPTRGQAVGVAVWGEHAFVADNSLGFDVVDTAGGGTRVGEYLGDGFPRAIGAVGDLVFVADQPNGLIVVDASTPTAPAPVGVLSLGADMITRVIVPQGIGGAPPPAIVCVVSGRAGLQVVDVSTPSVPAVAAPIPTAGPPRGIALRGHQAFVISNGTLEIFDLSRPSQPSRVASHDVGEQAGLVAVNDELIFVSVGAEIAIYGRQ